MRAHRDRSAAAGDPVDDDIDDDIWVPARQAALVLAKPERWLREECRAGHLPCEGEPRTGQVFLVPLAATEELADRPPPDDPGAAPVTRSSRPPGGAQGPAQRG